MLIGLIAALAAALLYGVAAVMQASASRGLPPIEQGALRLARTALSNPVLVVTVVMLVGGAVLHLVAIGRVPLYLAQAGIAAQLPITALVSAVTLHERLTGRDVVAVVSTFVGIALLAADAGESGATEHRPLLIVGLYVATVLLLALGALAYRARGRFAGASLGLLAGLGYAVTTLGARQLDAPYLSGHTAAIGVLIVVSGVSAFWLYSFSMQRISVAAASAPLVLAETLVPALIGVVVLGDGVPSWPVVVAGLLLAVAGAIYLAGFEGRVIEGRSPERDRADGLMEP